MQQLLKNYSNMFLVRGIAAILFGVLTLVWPKVTVLTLVILFGIFAIISGISVVSAALQNRGEHGWGVLLFEGILWLLVGAIALVWPGVTALSFLYLLAFWAVVTGMLEIIAPLSFPMSGGRGLLMVLSGLVSIVFGIVIAAQPAAGLLAVTWLIGIYAIIIGVISIVVYFEARSVTRAISQA